MVALGAMLARPTNMPASRARRQQPPITYRDRQDRVWSVSEVAVLKVVSPAIDGPNVALVIRFEHMGEERFARWLGDTDWRRPAALHRLFESVDTPLEDTGVGPAPPRNRGALGEAGRDDGAPTSSRTSRREPSANGTA